MDPVIWRALEDEELEGTQLSGLNVIDFSCKSPTFIIYIVYNHVVETVKLSRLKKSHFDVITGDK